MRAGDIFKFAHMSVFVTGLGISVASFGVLAGGAAFAQLAPETPLEEFEEETPPDEMPTDEMPPEEMPPEEMPPEEMPPEEMPPEEMPPEEMLPEEMPPEEMPPEEMPPQETPPEETPPMPEPPFDDFEELQDEQDDVNVDHPSANQIPRPKRLVKTDRGGLPEPGAPKATPEGTGSITKALGEAEAFCDNLVDERYVVDCIGERLLAVARAMPTTGEYAEARQIIEEAGQKLRALARANQSPSAPVGRARGNVRGRQVTTQPLVPVRRDRVKAVNRTATKVLQEAETKLLRAAAASDRRLIAYAQIAKAVGSNKKLLRSA